MRAASLSLTGGRVAMRHAVGGVAAAAAPGCARAWTSARNFSMTRLALGSIVPFNLSDIGEGTHEVQILKWFVKPGDSIRAFDKVCEVQTDKATAEISAPFDGVVRKLYTELNGVCKVGTPLIDVETEDQDAIKAHGGKSPSASSSQQPAAPAAASSAAKPAAASKPASGGASSQAGAKQFILPDIGEGTHEVQILSWCVKPGDKIEELDTICTVQTDKATADISSPVSGKVVKLYAETGAPCKVGTPLFDYVPDDAADEAGSAGAPASASHSNDAASAGHASAPAATSASSGNTTAMKGGKPLATPAVRRVAMENKIDLRQVAPTGKGGRILKSDVLEYIAGGAKRQTQAAPASAAAARNLSSSSVPVADTVPAGSARADRVEVIAGIKKAMVKSMTQALSIPAFGAKDEIEMDNLVKVRDDLRASVKARHDVKLSFMPFFIKAASLALDRFPAINAHTNADCSEVIYKGAHNISFAMDTPNGLMVPNVKDVHAKSIAEIAVAMDALMERGRRNGFTKADLSGGTFTLSNIGSIGATYTAPVIFPPQVAIGALGRMVKVPRFDAKNAIYPAKIVNVSWSADHRVVDGATMVRFGNQFKDYVERPWTMLTDLK